MIVPQGMSYANIAGVPSVYGLYGSFLPLMVYALLGSSRQLGVGPVAVTSLLIGSGIKNMLPGAENIDNPNAPAPQYAELQAEYNHKVSCMMMLQTTSLGCCEFSCIQSFIAFETLVLHSFAWCEVGAQAARVLLQTVSATHAATSSNCCGRSSRSRRLCNCNHLA